METSEAAKTSEALCSTSLCLNARGPRTRLSNDGDIMRPDEVTNGYTAATATERSQHAA